MHTNQSMGNTSQANGTHLDQAAVRRAGLWDALLGIPTQSMTPRAGNIEPARLGTKLARLLCDLATVKSLPTAALGARCDLDSRQVWGLLKAHRDDGQVRFDAGRWSLTPDYPGRDVQRAADLLRAKGWRVSPPNVGIEPPYSVGSNDGLGVFLEKREEL